MVKIIDTFSECLVGNLILHWLLVDKFSSNSPSEKKRFKNYSGLKDLFFKIVSISHFLPHNTDQRVKIDFQQNT